jgi:hypothetical protein
MGAGDVWATAGDLGIWNQALLSPERLLTGDNWGFRAINLLVPAEALTIILLANNEDLDLGTLGQKLLEQALEGAWDAE